MLTKQSRLVDDLSLLEIPTELMESEGARRALHAGLLEAKRAALTSAARLERWGRPLLTLAIGVSFLHAWESVAAIHPSFVQELTLPTWLYHTAAAAFTLVIDLASLYLVASGQVVMLAGVRPHARSRNFFLSVTLLLNMAFVVRNGPSVPDLIRANLLPLLDTSFVFLLPAVVMLAIVAIESAARQLKVVQLKLLAEVRMLEQQIEAVRLPAEAEQQSVIPALSELAANTGGLNTAPAPRSEDALLPTVAGSSAANMQHYLCPKCGTPLSMAKYAAARRYGHCASCKSKHR